MEKTHKILINVEDDETRIALVHGSTLENLYIEQTHRTQTVGNIYCGKVVKVQPSFQAAFVDYGPERHGFLAISDINPQLFKPSRSVRGRPSISQVLKSGQKILVQVIKDEVGHKGATLTTNISLPGRFLVFMPDSERGGVSRKIEDEEQRTRLKHLLKGLGSEDASVIIRTAGVDRDLTDLKRDFMNLRRTWTQVKQLFDESEKPGALYQEEEASTRMIRDYFNDDFAEVIIDDPNTFQRTLEFFQTHMPLQQNRLQLFLGENSLFASHGIEAQIERLYRNHVPLPSGGSLVVVPTEALVAIDVNSGRSTQEKNIEETALRTNLEAAEEAARQLRLRNLGGLIVIDFIDMDVVQNRRAVEQHLAEALTNDKAKWTLGEISQFGLLEMSRQRIAGSLSRNSSEITLANLILRKVQDLSVDQKVREIQMRLPLKLAAHLLNNKRRQLNQLEMDYNLRVNITPDPLLSLEEIPEMEVTHKTTGGEVRTNVPVHAAEMRDGGKTKPSQKRGRKKKTTGTEAREEAEEQQSTEEKDKPSTVSADDKQPAHSVAKLKETVPQKKAVDKPEPPEPEDKTVQTDSNKPVQQALTRPSPEESPGTGILFSSVHESDTEQESQTSDFIKPGETKKDLDEVPPNTILFSSVHLSSEETAPPANVVTEELPSSAKPASETEAVAKPAAKKRSRSRKKTADAKEKSVLEKETDSQKTRDDKAADVPGTEEKPKRAGKTGRSGKTKSAEKKDKIAPSETGSVKNTTTPGKKTGASTGTKSDKTAGPLEEGVETPPKEEKDPGIKPEPKPRRKASTRKTKASAQEAKTGKESTRKESTQDSGKTRDSAASKRKQPTAQNSKSSAKKKSESPAAKKSRVKTNHPDNSEE